MSREGNPVRSIDVAVALGMVAFVVGSWVDLEKKSQMPQLIAQGSNLDLYATCTSPTNGFIVEVVPEYHQSFQMEQKGITMQVIARGQELNQEAQKRGANVGTFLSVGLSDTHNSPKTLGEFIVTAKTGGSFSPNPELLKDWAPYKPVSRDFISDDRTIETIEGKIFCPGKVMPEISATIEDIVNGTTIRAWMDSQRS